MPYIIIDLMRKEGFEAADVPAVTEITGEKENTVHSWFRSGNRYHKVKDFIVIKGFKKIKSKRGGNTDNLIKEKVSKFEF